MNIIYKLGDNITNFIKYNLPYKSNDELEIARYGITLFLMELYKFPIVFGLAFYLGIFKYCFLTYILFSILRSQSHGLHLSNGKQCLFYSTISIFSIVYFSKFFLLSLIFKLLISVITLYSIYRYAPADTEKKPILNPIIRKNKKTSSFLIAFFYIFFSFTFSDYVITNIFFLTLILLSIVINPLTYKLLNRRYNNYEYY